MRFQLRSCIKYVWFDRSCMFNTFLNENILRIIRIKCVICIILNTRIKQLSCILYNKGVIYFVYTIGLLCKGYKVKPN